MIHVSPSVVRIASMADHQECWRLALQNHTENGLFKLAPDKVDWWFRRMLNPSSIHPLDTFPRGSIGVIGPVGALEGMCMLVIADHWYTTEKHLEEFLVFVDPEFRASGHAKALVAWMKGQAEITGIPLLTGIISKERTEAKCRLYRRMVPKVGEYFLYSGSVRSSSLVAA